MKLISLHCRPFLLAAVLVPASVHVAFCAESTTVRSTAAPYCGVLVLREGGVLTGAITQSGDRYLVKGEGSGSELNVPIASVAIVCRTLQEAYEHRHNTLDPPNAEGHLGLAEWCLRCNLLPQAAQELVAARGMEPRNPKIAILERRLIVASQPPVGRAAPTAMARPPAHAQNAVGSAEESESIGDELSDAIVERFTRKVQPLLVNGCTNGGCHRPGGEQPFQLDRALLHGMANRRSTRQNLAAVLALVNRARPQESQLLAIPRQDHGGMDRPIFGPRQSQQFEQLAEWVSMLASPAVGDAEPSLAQNRPVVTEQVPSEENGLAKFESPPQRGREPVTRAVYSANGKRIDPGLSNATAAQEIDEPGMPAKFNENATDDFVLPPLAGSQPLRMGAPLEVWQPKDPFDPETFNRQTARANTRDAERD